ncbi:MAG: sigma-54-dependent Fis family transcriptional regulator [marine bacterium B5-7]|nr:MAG: sigma-54-dependent Fis family transcriptional regulator [marine bacterium B5-7]
MNYTVLIVEDDNDLREALTDTLTIAGYIPKTAANGEDALDVLQNETIDMVISDVQMARMDGINLLKRLKTTQASLPVILMTAFGSVKQAVDAMQIGAVDYLVKPFEPEVLVSKVSQFLPTVLTETDTGFVAADVKTKEVMEIAKRVSDSDATLLITGESGTGKEVLAQYIHQQSPRSKKPFVAINCAAIPENMLEAILFGYQKGAYTGAYKSCPGKFEQAQDGTILLDEISEMSLPLQAKLLRVLQEKEVERLGDQNSIELNVRVIATSNRNMRKEVTAGHFREDLFYRLNVFPINMPALRERKEDIVPIAEFLLARAATANNAPCPELSTEVCETLKTYSWPGNVRELDNVMQRSLILQMTGVITTNEIQFEQQTYQGITTATEMQDEVEMDTETDSKLSDDLKVREQNMIIEALKETMGSRKSAAEKLGISPRTLRYKLAKMREHGVAIPIS